MIFSTESYGLLTGSTKWLGRAASEVHRPSPPRRIRKGRGEVEKKRHEGLSALVSRRGGYFGDMVKG